MDAQGQAIAGLVAGMLALATTIKVVVAQRRNGNGKSNGKAHRSPCQELREHIKETGSIREDVAVLTRAQADTGKQVDRIDRNVDRLVDRFIQNTDPPSTPH